MLAGISVLPLLMGASEPRDFAGILKFLGLFSDAEIVLDAGDAASYPGTGGTWSDVSGNGYLFTRTSSLGVVFNGVAGGLTDSEYFSFNGSSYWTSSARTDWTNGLHKNNAAWSAVCWLRTPSSTPTSRTGIIGTYGSPGGDFEINDRAPKIHVRSGGGNINTEQSNMIVANSTWQMLSMAIDEAVGAGGLTFGLNDNFTSHTSTYSSPSSSASENTLKIADTGNGSSNFFNGGRMAMIAAFNRRLSQAELTAVYEATKKRFNL